MLQTINKSHTTYNIALVVRLQKLLRRTRAWFSNCVAIEKKKLCRHLFYLFNSLIRTTFFSFFCLLCNICHKKRSPNKTIVLVAGTAKVIAAHHIVLYLNICVCDTYECWTLYLLAHFMCAVLKVRVYCMHRERILFVSQ